jgi:hypothetical protein
MCLSVLCSDSNVIILSVCTVATLCSFSKLVCTCSRTFSIANASAWLLVKLVSSLHQFYGWGYGHIMTIPAHTPFRLAPVCVDVYGGWVSLCVVCVCGYGPVCWMKPLFGEGLS